MLYTKKVCQCLNILEPNECKTIETLKLWEMQNLWPKYGTYNQDLLGKKSKILSNKSLKKLFIRANRIYNQKINWVCTATKEVGVILFQIVKITDQILQKSDNINS